MVNNGLATVCFGCGMCAAACPKQIITMQLSNEGFFVPFIKEQECIQCGLCEKVCSYLDSDIMTPIDALSVVGFAAYTKNESDRYSSSSGGIGNAISKCFLQKGYDIIGVYYDLNDNIAKHSISDNMEILEKFKGSKYLQSYTYDALIKIDKHKKYVFFGTPCQIDSLRRYIKFRKIEENFLLIDFFCHGVPSYYVWNSYLKEKNVNNIKKVSFRDKRFGWHNFTLSIEYNDKEVVNRLHHNDYFYNLFLGDLCSNHCCYTCKFRADKSSADIRFGDLWGHKYIKDDKGVSGILINTEQGKEAFQSIKEEINYVSEEFDIILEGQIKSDISIPTFRKNIITSLQEGKKISYVYHRWAWKMLLRNLIPSSVKRYLKKYIL